ncbi:MAG: hypothetical protein AAF385_07520 [Pseudomonadota bacterium]
MRFRTRSLWVVALLALLSACENASDSAEPVEPVTDAETVFDPLQESLERAKEAEAMVEERKRELDNQLEELESGKSD